MNSSQFSDFIIRQLIPGLSTFSQSKTFTGSGKYIVVNWPGKEFSEMKFESDSIGATNLPGESADIFRIFFTEEPMNFVSLNMAHLTFSLNPEGALIVSSSRIRNKPQQIQINTYHPEQELMKSTIQGILENQFLYQKTWL